MTAMFRRSENSEYVDQLEHETAELRAEIRRLREAAEPFVRLADEADTLRHSDDSTCMWRLRAGDLRALRDA